MFLSFFAPILLQVAIVGGDKTSQLKSFAEDGVISADSSKAASSIEEPHLLEVVDPVVPGGEEYKAGTCRIRMLVLATGDVGEVTVLRSISQKIDSAVVDSAKQYKFIPAKQNNKAIDAFVEMDIRVNMPFVRRKGLIRR